MLIARGWKWLARTWATMSRRLTAARRSRSVRNTLLAANDAARRRGASLVAICLLERFGDILACSGIVSHFQKARPGCDIVWIGMARYRDVAVRIPGVRACFAVECYGELDLLLAQLSEVEVIDLNLNGKQCPCCRRPWRNRSGATATTENYLDFGPLVTSFTHGLDLPERDWPPALSRHETGNLQRAFAERPFAVVHSASEEAARGWRAEGWARLVDVLLADTAWNVVHVGGKPAAWLEAHERVFELGGKTDIAELMAIVERSALFVGIESSVGHVANAYRRPGMVLLGRYRVFARYTTYTGSYGEAGDGACLVRNVAESIDLPPDVAERALRSVLRRLRLGRAAGVGGALNLRTTAFARQPAVATGPDIATLLLLAGDVRGSRPSPAGGVAIDDMVWALPMPTALPARDDEELWMDAIDAAGGRFVWIVPAGGTTTIAIDCSRYLRLAGEPMVLERAADGWQLRSATAVRGAVRASERAGVMHGRELRLEWPIADARGAPGSIAFDMTPWVAGMAAAREAVERVTAVGQLVDVEAGGVEAALDSVSRRADGNLGRLTGWAFLARPGRPPDLLAFAERVDGRARLLQTMRFPRLDREDVARAHSRPDARFSGFALEVPSFEFAPAALELLAHDAVAMAWHRVPLPAR
jgi:ADP-heptose:LPS heptosyltransferase